MSLGEYNGAGSGTTCCLYHFNGGDATDSSGNGGNGTSTNMNYGQAYGRFGQGAVFDGTGDIITCPSISSKISGGTALTVNAWIYKDNTVSTLRIICAERQQSGSLYLNFNFLKDTAQKLVFATYGTNNANGINVLSTSALPDQVWTMVTGVYNGTDLRVYINGKLDCTPAAQTATFSNIASSNFMIGRSSGTSGDWKGRIDEIFVENVAWSANKVKRFYTQSKGRFANL